MKALFKYAFLSGFFIRGAAFAVIFILYSLLIIFGSMDKLPLIAHIAAISLGGIAVAVMFAANIGGDISIARKMFAVPASYLNMLTPVPRWKILLSGSIAMAVMDIFSMVFVIIAQVWLVFNLIGNEVWQNIWETVSTNNTYMLYGLWSFLMLIASYILILMIILFCVTMKKSLFYKMPASGLLSFLLACCCFCIANLLQLIITPLNEVQRFGTLIVISPEGGTAFPFLILLTLLQAAGVFVLTSKLMEKKLNL